MATKTTSKTAAKSAARKTTSASKSTAAKPKVATKKKEPEAKPAARSHAPAPAKAPVKAAKPAPAAAPVSTPPAPRRAVESVSLIDKRPTAKKGEDGEVKKRTTVLPPISRIRASMEAPPAPKPPPPEPEVQAPPVEPAAPEAAPAAEAEEDGRKIIHIKPPIIVKDLAAQLGVKNHVLIKELMELQVFANQNQTIEPDIATKIAEKHGLVLEKERREK